MWPLYLPITLLCAYLVYNRFFHPLAKVPGPVLAGATPLWLVWQCMNQRRPSLDLELHKRYGGVVRIAPNEIIFSNPEYFKTVYGAGSKFTKSRFYEAPTDNAQQDTWDKLDMLAEFDIGKLRLQHRLAGPVYSTANATKHEGHIDNNVRRWFMKLSSLAGRALDLWTEIELLNVDVMTELTFAEPFGAVEAGTDGGHMHTMWSLWKHWAWIGNLPWLNWLDKKYAPAQIVLGVSMPRLPVFPHCVGKIAAYQQAADAGKSNPPCIHDDFIRLSVRKPEFRTNWGVRLSITDLGAGVDTMSQTMAAVIAGVSMDKRAYSRLQAELDAAVSRGSISKGEPVPYDEAAKLDYLQVCMHEAMRMWPNIAIGLPRVVPHGGMTIDGFHLPAGVSVGLNPRQLGRSEEVFGHDPDTFRPERWLEASKERRYDMENRNLAFGGPSRRCPGMHLAWVVMSKVLASFFLEFDVVALNELDGEAGPGGGRWIEKGAFPLKWFGWEVELGDR